jgi:MSHA pilin protein MshC
MRRLIVAGGFTLVEMISVIVIMGVLAITALPRFAEVDVFASRGFFEQAVAATRYAHKLAIASGCSIEVNFIDANERFTVSRWTGGADCTERTLPLELVAQPGSNSDYALTAPDGVDISNDLLFYFDRVGRPHDAVGNLITLSADLQVSIDLRQLQIIPETGLVVEN